MPNSTFRLHKPLSCLSLISSVLGKLFRGASMAFDGIPVVGLTTNMRGQ